MKVCCAPHFEQQHFHAIKKRHFSTYVQLFKYLMLDEICDTTLPGAPNSAKFKGGWRFDKGGVTKSYDFLRDKNINFLEVHTLLSD